MLTPPDPTGPAWSVIRGGWTDESGPVDPAGRSAGQRTAAAVAGADERHLRDDPAGHAAVGAGSDDRVDRAADDRRRPGRRRARELGGHRLHARRDHLHRAGREIRRSVRPETGFQLSVLIFIVGSFFCGLSQNMTTLIAFRAVQGIGGGGLAVTATCLLYTSPSPR